MTLSRIGLPRTTFEPSKKKAPTKQLDFSKAFGMGNPRAGSWFLRPRDDLRQWLDFSRRESRKSLMIPQLQLQPRNLSATTHDCLRGRTVGA
jgi:hypothetical protein